MERISEYFEQVFQSVQKHSWVIHGEEQVILPSLTDVEFVARTQTSYDYYLKSLRLGIDSQTTICALWLFFVPLRMSSRLNLRFFAACLYPGESRLTDSYRSD